ncbi:MAG: hypothetical protein PHQ47_01410 [Candidatus Portnoybacteria bacterium]|nr:hypothetical protein [Candidatus Portnoybacteria bacterium]
MFGKPTLRHYVVRIENRKPILCRLKGKKKTKKWLIDEGAMPKQTVPIAFKIIPSVLQDFFTEIQQGLSGVLLPAEISWTPPLTLKQKKKAEKQKRKFKQGKFPNGKPRKSSRRGKVIPFSQELFPQTPASV